MTDKPVRTCSFVSEEGVACVGMHKAKGYCNAHYRQLLKNEPIRELRAWKRICTFPECGKKHCGLGLCNGHLFQYHNQSELTPLRERIPNQKSCNFQNCDRPHMAKGWCSAHYNQVRENRELKPIRQAYGVCQFEGCNKLPVSRGLCSGHRTQRNKNKKLTPLKTNPNRGRGYFYKNGYKILFGYQDHPNSNSKGQISEHILIWTETHGPLSPKQTIHHINGVRDDNRLENLQLRQGQHGSGIVMECRDCGSQNVHPVEIGKTSTGSRVSDTTTWAKEWLAKHEPEALA